MTTKISKNTQSKNKTKSTRKPEIKKNMKRLWHIKIKQSEIWGTELRFLKDLTVSNLNKHSSQHTV